MDRIKDVCLSENDVKYNRSMYVRKKNLTRPPNQKSYIYGGIKRVGGAMRCWQL